MLIVAPGVSLPSKGSMWAVDGADPSIAPVQLYRTSVKVNCHTAKNFVGGFAASYLYRPSISIEIPGAHSQTRLEGQRLVFYLRSEEVSEDFRPGTDISSLVTDFILVHLKIHKKTRVEESMSRNEFGHQVKRTVDEVKVTNDKLDSGWLRLTTSEPLEAGEYAFISFPRDKGRLNSYAYDFGIDPPKSNP
jgi:hypothetical protein